MIGSIHPEAEAEYVEAAAYYESRSTDLSVSFVAAIEHTLAFIRRYPEAGAPEGDGLVRRRLVPRFPFAIVYRHGPETLEIVAIAHARRRPGYWQRRIDAVTEDKP